MDFRNLSFTCDLCLLKCFKPLEDKVDALGAEVSGLKKLVTSILNNSISTHVPQPKITAKKPKTISINDSPSTNDVFFSPNPELSTMNRKPGHTSTNGGILGTGPRSENITLAEPRFWMYLAGLDPSTDECDVDTYVKSVFHCDTIRSKKLLPPNRDPDTCEFVSFKIGFPLELKENALQPGVWPEGIIVREFNDRKPKKLLARSRMQSRDIDDHRLQRPRSRSRQNNRGYPQPSNSNFRSRRRSQSRNGTNNYGRRNSYRRY
jgi:hypothetical protein